MATDPSIPKNTDVVVGTVKLIKSKKKLGGGANAGDDNSGASGDKPKFVCFICADESHRSKYCPKKGLCLMINLQLHLCHLYLQSSLRRRL